MPNMSEKEILYFLESKDANDLIYLINKAGRVREKNIGNVVYARGLIEFSNICSKDCFYCGLRRSNRKVNRYHLSKDEILLLANTAYKNGFHSIALQSGEIPTESEVDFLADVIYEIKKTTSQNNDPGLGITLSIGELTFSQYKKLYDAGAHRYLLRIETSNPDLFARMHPPEQSFQKRLECLYALKEIGYQVGTGVMIGLPHQSYENLACDLKFFLDFDIDMLGMGPYIPHPDTPLAQESKIKIDPYISTVKMISLARILMPDINIVASTALQTIHPEGLKMGLKAGANIVMPVLTPEERREDYSLYTGKKYTPFNDLFNQIQKAGFEIVLWKWGDPPHWYKRHNLTYIPK
ncbi:[FeFe] hydrogenase H-cluster radical SAM maturase HydE [Thermosyntropha sp.]|uniref:[FeFe] hydrogenase H-cluster radical SAM maturase HydE n=1 Tax=Thermosyntropha sp. TaxID=2740820 RepID=UPI0025F67901|nr:[FeFe] hydrogenase H-cluster radical SAM maturase HydE [Thermosyntropha sp.]MBO8158907.1 [FeFe] hydrogenase H-cluster radical SAM maturase HydE [Thermosyntropha sp.]